MKRRLPNTLTNVFVLLIVSITLLPPAHAAPAPAPGSAGYFDLIFTGNQEVDMQIQVDPDDTAYIRWGELHRDGTLVKKFTAKPGVTSEYYRDENLNKGVTYEYEFKTFRKDRQTGVEALTYTRTESTTTGQVQGHIAFDMTWRGDWHLTGSGVYVYGDVKLTIASGTVVHMDTLGADTIRLLEDSALKASGATLRNVDIHGGSITVKNSTLDNSIISGEVSSSFENNSGTCAEIGGIGLGVSKEARIRGNMLPTCSLGISRRPGSRNLLVENNQFKSFGISGAPAPNAIATVQNNIFTGGVSIGGSGAVSPGPFNYLNNQSDHILVSNLENLKMEGNQIRITEYHSGGALHLSSGVTGAEIISNTILVDTPHAWAINIQGSVSALPNNNTIKNNFSDGKIAVGSANNTIHNNAFFDAVMLTNVGQNTWNTSKTGGTNIVGGPYLGGNYWKNHTLTDADGDKIGDSPIQFDANNKDNLPLVWEPGPNFMVQPFALTASTVTYDSEKQRYTLPVDVLIENIGEDGAQNIPVRLSDNGDWSTVRTIPDLQPGVSHTLHLDWDITPILAQGFGIHAPTLTVLVDPDETTEDTIRVNNRQSSRLSLDARPQVSAFEPEFNLDRSYFLDKQSVSNPIRVEIDWNGDLPGRGETPYGEVHFELNGDAQVETGLEWGAARTYDMGTDFESNFECANNTLTVWATYPTAEGNFISDKLVVQPTVFPFPGWFEWIVLNLPNTAAEFEVETQAPVVKYFYDFFYPEPPFEGIWIPPTWMPFIGGQRLGVEETQAQAKLHGRSDGAGLVGVSGNTGLSLGPVTASGEVSGDGSVHFRCGDSLKFEGATYTFKIFVAVQKETGLVDLIPALSEAEDWPVVGRAIKWVNHLAKVRATFTPGIEIETHFVEWNDQLVYQDGTGTGSLDLKVALAVETCDDLSAEVYGGGTPYVTIQVPKKPSYLKEFGFDVYYGAAFKAWKFAAKYERKFNCNYPDGCSEVADPGLLALAPPVWQLTPRDYVGPSYAAFAAQGVRASRVLNATTSAETLVSNIYPHPEPALAVHSDDTRLLAYVHDDPAKPNGRGTEIHALTWDGAWSSPVTLTNDLLADYAPATAFDDSGNGLLLWERSTLSSEITPSLDITFARSIEIAARAWDGAAWSETVTLTQNSLTDQGPQLASGSDGSVIALWRTHDGHDMFGTPTHPLTLTTAMWDGANWQPPTAALTGLQNVVDTALAVYSATQAAQVFVHDVDGNLDTLADTQLFYSLFDGGAWSAPTPFASDSITDALPALAYDATGDLHLLWLRDGNLVSLLDSWDVGDVQVVQAAASEGGVLGFTLERAPDGNLALVWQAMEASGANLAYSIYDGAAGDWGAAQSLMADDAVETAHSPAFGIDGTLYLAYREVATNYVTRTYTISPTESVTITNIPDPGQSDLVFLSHSVGHDLSFDSLGVAPPNPAPGETFSLTAVLRNAGDLSVGAPQVAFFDADSALYTATLPNLKAGYTATVQLTGTLSLSDTAHTLRAIADPAALLAESDEDNNEIALQTTLPDIEIKVLTTAYSDDGLHINARLANGGVRALTELFDVVLRAGNPLTGSHVLTLTAGSVISVGQQITLTGTVTEVAALAGAGDTLWAIADASGAVDEADEDNNLAFAALKILPNLSLSAADVQGSDPVSVTLHNTGALTATGVMLVVRGVPLTGTLGLNDTLVFSDTFAEIAPGGSVSVTFAHAAQSSLWANADPDNSIPEIDESDNLAAREFYTWVEVSYPIYLPLILRNL